TWFAGILKKAVARRALRDMKANRFSRHWAMPCRYVLPRARDPRHLGAARHGPVAREPVRLHVAQRPAGDRLLQDPGEPGVRSGGAGGAVAAAKRPRPHSATKIRSRFVGPEPFGEGRLF